MQTLTIEIEGNLRTALEKMAIQNGKKADQFVVEIIDDYLEKNSAENCEIAQWMKASETSFSDWNNEEDCVYDRF